jgi:hypothetical protein
MITRVSPDCTSFTTPRLKAGSGNVMTTRLSVTAQCFQTVVRVPDALALTEDRCKGFWLLDSLDARGFTNRCSLSSVETSF